MKLFKSYISRIENINYKHIIILPCEHEYTYQSFSLARLLGLYSGHKSKYYDIIFNVPSET